MAEITVTRNQTPGIPSTGQSTIYIDSSDNILKYIDDNGVIRTVAAAEEAFVPVTEGGELSDLCISYDVAVNGTAVFTLPTPATELNGLKRHLYRTGAFDATDYISITGHIEGNATAERRMGLINEHFKFRCDGTTWLEDGHNTQAFCTPQVTSAQTFSLTTSYTKFTEWDTNPVFDTAGRLLWNKTNNQIDIPVIESLVQDGFSINLIMIIEFTNNKIVEGIIAIDGVQTNGSFPVNGLGIGKPVQLQMPLAIGVAAGTDKTIEVQLKGESAGTLDILSARWTVSRIKG